MPAGATIAASAVSIGSTLLASDSQGGAADKIIKWTKPYEALGRDASGALRNFLGLSGTGGPFSPEALAGNPIYNFIKDEGLKGVQNSYAAKGLGSSGAALKGAADYATGSAGTFMNQIYNMLHGATGLGVEALTGTAATNQAAGDPGAAGALGIGGILSDLIDPSGGNILAKLGIGGGSGQNINYNASQPWQAF